MNLQLARLFRQKARQERLHIVKSIVACKMEESSVCVHIQQMKSYIDQLENLQVIFDQKLAIDIILNSLTDAYDGFILTNHMQSVEKMVMELYNKLQTTKAGINKTGIETSTVTPVLPIQSGGGKRRKRANPKWKGKASAGSNHGGGHGNTSVQAVNDPKEAICFYCNVKGHWKRNFPKYLQYLKDGNVKETGSSTSTYMIELHHTIASNNFWVLDTGCATHIYTVLLGLKARRTLKHGEMNMIMGNRRTSPVSVIGDFEVSLSSDVSFSLSDCCYSPELTRNINGCFMFKTSPYNGIYESVVCLSNNNNINLNIDSTNEVDKSCLWHYRFGHINKKCISKLQSEGILESFDLKSDDVCEPCLLGKMTNSHFTGTCKRGEGLLDLIHMDVCGPFRSPTGVGRHYYITFTDDFSNRNPIFEKFKEYRNEVQNRLGKKIKVLCSGRGEEYLSIEFNDYLRDCGIVSHLTPPRTPQLNGVAERRNQTLLDIVRSMMSRASLPITFWWYALETAAHILNRVPTKKDSKTPFEIWSGKVPSLKHIKIWGCEAFVKRDTSDKLESRSERYRFVGVFLEREMMSQEVSGSPIDLEEIQVPRNDEPIVDTSTQPEVEQPVEPTDTSLLLRRTARVSNHPQFYGFHITTGGDTLIDDKTLINLDEHSN
ncbi:hypothetical protein LXL04_020157 [Taraxacum kok-saghyz]